MSKKIIRNNDGSISHWCDGCKKSHIIYINLPHPQKGIVWVWNGDNKKPTFVPSVRHTLNGIDGADNQICHYLISGGQIKYYHDSTHALSGHLVALSDIPNLEIKAS